MTRSPCTLLVSAPHAESTDSLEMLLYSFRKFQWRLLDENFWCLFYLINNLPIDLARSSMQHWRYEACKNRYKESDHSIRTYSWDCLGFSVVPILSAEYIKSNYFLYFSPGGSAFKQCCNNFYVLS